MLQKISGSNTYLDSDDIWVSEKLEIQLKCMIENETSLVFSAGFVFSEDVAHPDRNYSTISGAISGDAGFKYLLKQNFIPLPSVLVKKSVIDEVGGFDASPDIQNVEDYQLWLNLLLKGISMYGMQEKLFFYRLHSLQETANDPYASERVLTMLDSHLEAPERFSKDLRKAKMLWGKDWYSYNAVNRKSASEILRKMASVSHLKLIALVTRLSLLFFGVQLSKKIINRWVRLFASEFQNIDFQGLKS
jgi:teichuronic acid biosynthesis glycosyltransferase TuaG